MCDMFETSLGWITYTVNVTHTAHVRTIHILGMCHGNIRVYTNGVCQVQSMVHDGDEPEVYTQD